MALPAAAADLTFTRAYQGGLSGQTFTTTTLLNADAGSIRFSDGGTQRAFQNTSGTLSYTVAGVPHSEVGVLNSRYPNGNTLMNAVAFSGGSGDRLLVLGGAYTTSSAYSGSSNAIVAKLNEYVDATAPDPAGTTLLVNGGTSATASVGATATIIVTVKLASGTAVSGATASLSGNPSGGSSISPASTTTNSSGQATFTVQGLQSGTVTYNAVASANGTTTTSTNSVSVTFVGTRSAAQSTANAPAGVAGRATAVVITVRDTNGNTMTGAAGGLALAVGGANAGVTPGAVVDNGNGTYSVAYTPSAVGVDTLAITLDGVAISGSPYSSTVAAAPTPPAITTASLPTPVLGQSYSQTIATSGGTAPVTFAVTAGALPTGLVLNASSGVVTGAATAAGAYSVTVTATDANGLTDAKTYSGTISVGVVITTATLPIPILGQSYNQTIATSGGTAPVTFAVTAGALPTGLALNASTGAISGTTTAAGAYSVTITATDANGLTDAKTYSGTISAGVVITTMSLPTPVLGQAYNQTIATTGGTVPVSFAVTAGALPTGLALNASTGAISGTTTAAGAYSVTITATDANGLTDAKTYSGTISAGVVITTMSLPIPVLGQAYSQTLATSGGTAPVSFAVTAGALPTGLALDASTGAISGTATAAGAYSVTVTATDANGLTDAKTYSGTISAGAVITTMSLPTPVLGQAYNQTIATTGGTVPVSFAVTAGALPTGLALNASTGAISGTTTAAGAYSVTITATDANGLTDAKTYSGTISAGVVITTATLPIPVLGQAYSQTLATTGGTAPVTFAVTAGALPTGLALNASTGAISGTTTAAGAYSVTVTATDANGLTDAKTYSGTISAGAVITTMSLPIPILGQSYSQTLATSGGTAPVTFAVTAGALPTGLALDASTGAITGAASAAGAYSVTITATDANGLTDAKTYSGTIAAVLAAPITGSVSITVAANSSANAVTPNLSGGTADSVAVASSPSHGVATASGLSIAYTPAAGFSGSDSFTYTAANGAGVSSAATITVTITAPSLVFGPTSGALPGGVVGAPYSQTIAASDGATPYAYAVSGGAPPAGLTLDGATGAVRGTPTTVGTFAFVITATDANGATGTANYSVVIAAAAPVAADSTTATVPANTQTQAGQNVSLNLSSLVSGDVSEVRIVTQPQHGSVTITQTLALRGGGGLFAMALAGASAMSTPGQFIAVYTPEKDFQGVDSFAFVAVGPGGISAPATATITVVGQAPVARAHAASTTDGKMVSVDLADGATEGPFTGASLGAISPADAATINLVQGGTATSRTFRLDVTPKVRFGGTITINYTLTNVFGVSSPAAVVITVAARPDPAADPLVQAVSDAQAEATRRFSRAQVDNFIRRAERLHGADCLPSGNGVRLNAIDKVRSDDPRGRAGGPEPTRDGAANQERTPATERASSAEEKACRRGDLSAWTGGSIELSTRDASSGASKIRATSSGLSLGVDARVSDRASIGVGVGYGEDRNRVGGQAGRVSAQSKVVAAYGSLTPVDGVFVDGMIARGWLDFDTRRLDATSGATTLGDREGRFTTIALSSGLDRETGPLSWSGYGRLEYLDGSLDAYREEGAGIFDLRFDARKIRSRLGVLGLRVTYSRPVRVGLLTLGLRGEWRHEFSGGSRQGVDYADVSGASFYSLPSRDWSREEFMFDPELGLLLPSGWELGLAAGLRASAGENATQGRMEARRRF